jgi:hypothetical protein
MSGKSNVVYWLESHSKQVTDGLVAKILAQAKRSSKVLTDDELEQLCKS